MNTAQTFTDTCKEVIAGAKSSLNPAEYLRHLYHMEGTISLLIAQAQSEEIPVKKVRGKNKAKSRGAELPLNQQEDEK